MSTAQSGDPNYHHLLLENTITHEDDQINPEDWIDDSMPEDLEGLFQAATVLRGKGANLLVRDYAKTDEEDFSRWTLTSEQCVIIPRSDSELSAWTNGKYQQLQDCAYTGLELISPILEVPDMADLKFNGLVEVNKFLSYMTENQNGPCFFSAVPQNSSVHVHIGVPPTVDGASVDIPLDILRHLAWICVAFEDAITLLHHPERHGYVDTKIWTNAEPNRVFLGRNDPRDPLHNCVEGPVFSPQDEFIKIFDFEYCDDDIDRRKLKELLCTRMGNLYGQATGKVFVNFANIVPFASDPPHSKRTVEFRQHHGTLSAEDIGEWIIFVTALVRAAERKANEIAFQIDLPGPFIQSVVERQGNYAKQLLTLEQAWKYADMLWEKKRSLHELFDLLELPVYRRRYWWERARIFRSSEYSEYRMMSTCQPPCQKAPRRDCIGWKEGELDLPPWDP